jgi:hypothetical protein
VGDYLSPSLGLAWPLIDTLTKTVNTVTGGAQDKADHPPNETANSSAPQAEVSQTLVKHSSSESNEKSDNCFHNPRQRLISRVDNVHGLKSSKTTTKRPMSQTRTIVGKNVSKGFMSFKGADLTVQRYIGRVDISTDIGTVKNHLTENGVAVIEFEELKTIHSRFKSFRLRLKRSELTIIEKPEFWPDDVIVRPYYRAKVSNVVVSENGDSSVPQIAHYGS